MKRKFSLICLRVAQLYGEISLFNCFQNNQFRLDLFYGHEAILSLDRIYAQATKRARSIDYHHVIHSLAKKPNAFKCSQLRDDLLPKGDLWQLWQQLTRDGVTDEDCRYMVDLLLIAHNYEC